MTTSHQEVSWTYLKKAGFIIVLTEGCTDRLELSKSQGILDLFRRGNDYVIKDVESRTADYREIKCLTNHADRLEGLRHRWFVWI